MDHQDKETVLDELCSLEPNTQNEAYYDNCTSFAVPYKTSQFELRLKSD
jgi:hypothetical protein